MQITRQHHAAEQKTVSAVFRAKLIDQQADEQRQHVPDSEHVYRYAFGEVDEPGEEEQGYVEEKVLHLMGFNARAAQGHRTRREAESLVSLCSPLLALNLVYVVAMRSSCHIVANTMF